jgi:uncharacterized damage-inducible protein DinB
MPLSPSTAARLATQLECLPALLDGVGADALRARTRSGKWSVHENLAHLARHHAIVLERVRRIRAEDRPALDRYAAENDVEWPSWAALGTDEVLDRLRTLRRELTAAVTSLSDDDLARVGVHPAMGEMPLGLWIEFFLLHEAHHLYLVLKRARGGE